MTETSSLHFNIYGTPNCAKCGLTIRQLSQVITKSDYTHTILDTPEAINTFKVKKGVEQSGRYSMPYVEVVDKITNQVIDTWNDFQVRKIEEYKNKLK